jgi:hypothetical protein
MIFSEILFDSFRKVMNGKYQIDNILAYTYEKCGQNTPGT